MSTADCYTSPLLIHYYYYYFLTCLLFYSYCKLPTSEPKDCPHWIIYWPDGFPVSKSTASKTLKQIHYITFCTSERTSSSSSDTSYEERNLFVTKRTWKEWSVEDSLHARTSLSTVHYLTVCVARSRIAHLMSTITKYYHIQCSHVTVSNYFHCHHDK